MNTEFTKKKWKWLFAPGIDAQLARSERCKLQQHRETAALAAQTWQESKIVTGPVLAKLWGGTWSGSLPAPVEGDVASFRGSNTGDVCQHKSVFICR